MLWKSNPQFFNVLKGCALLRDIIMALVIINSNSIFYFMSYILSRKFWSVISALFIGAAFLFTAMFASAASWTPPSNTFQSGWNIEPPIHEGSTYQKKGSASALDPLGLTPSQLSPITAFFDKTVDARDLFSRRSIFSDQFIATQYFCLTPNIVGFLDLAGGGYASDPNCIDTWPTVGTDSLWSEDANANTMWNTAIGRNVGIGISSPQEKLDVAGDAIVRGSSFNAPGATASVSLGDGQHSIRADWGSGLVFDTFGVTDPVVIKQNTGNVGIGTTDPTASLDIDGTFRLRGTPTPGDALIASPAGDGTVEWGTIAGDGSLPVGTNTQTMRHNGTDWVADSKLRNDGNGIRIGMNEFFGSANWNTPFTGYEFAVGGDVTHQSDVVNSLVSGTNTQIGNPLEVGYSLGFAQDLTDVSKLTVFGQSVLANNNTLSILPDDFTQLGFTFTAFPEAEDTKLRVYGDSFTAGDAHVEGELTVEEDAYLKGRTSAHRITIQDQGNSSIPGGVLEAWDGEFEWNGSGGSFDVGTTALFENDVTVEQLAHEANAPLQVCADNDGKLVLCESDHGAMIYDTPGTYTFQFPANINLGATARVEVWGAGGGGGAGRTQTYGGSGNVEDGGSGGGAGGYIMAEFTPEANATYSVTVGAPGTRGLGDANSITYFHGGNGGNSIFNRSQPSGGGPNVVAFGGTKGFSDGAAGTGGSTAANNVNVLVAADGQNGTTDGANPSCWGGHVGGNGGHSNASFGVWQTGGSGGSGCSRHGNDGSWGTTGGGGGGGQGGGEATWVNDSVGGHGGLGGPGKVKITW